MLADVGGRDLVGPAQELAPGHVLLGGTKRMKWALHFGSLMLLLIMWIAVLHSDRRAHVTGTENCCARTF